MKNRVLKAFTKLNLLQFLLMITVLLNSCQLKNESIAEIPTTRLPIATPSLYPTATPTITIASPTLEPSPQASETQPFLVPKEILTSEFEDDDFQDLIIFSTSRVAYTAFAGFPVNFNWAEATETHVYAFSPDGRRAGTLTPQQFAATLHPPTKPSNKALMIEYGVEFNHPDVLGVILPEDCYQPQSNVDQLYACGRFQFSPNGEYLGFFHGPPLCGRGIIIKNTQTGEEVYRLENGSGHSLSIIDNGRALVASGHCEGGQIDFHNLTNGTEVSLGTEGEQIWNASKTALAVAVSEYANIASHIWGFNVETEQLFMKQPNPIQIDDHPIWVPDQQHFLYQHRTFTRREGETYPTGFDTARQIILVDIQTGIQTTLLSDAAYDFHLGSCFTCADWYGDWIQVRRVAFVPEAIRGGDSIYSAPAVRCRIYGESCAAPTELFALNWKTGELLSWSDAVASGTIDENVLAPTAIIPVPNQQSIFEISDQYQLYQGPTKNTFFVHWRWASDEKAFFLAGPDLITTPIYKHPTGNYAFYLGIDGRSLWMVPSQGLPIPWVLDGENFFYLGKK